MKNHTSLILKNITASAARYASVSLALLGLCVSMSVAQAAAAPSTVALRLRIHDLQPGPGYSNQLQVTNLAGTTLGTCQEPPATPHTTCIVLVPTNQSIVIAAQASAGHEWKSWRGADCAAAPGPVCHIAVGITNERVSATFDAMIPGPVLTTATPTTYGHSPTLSFGNNQVQAFGAGFAGSSPATLTDDGAVVATGITSADGSISLTYNADSEPGIYRQLALTVAGQKAETDVYNSLVYTWGESGQGSGSVAFTVNETGLDANQTENYVQFNGGTPVPVTFADGSATQGYAQITTPQYTCAAGSSEILRIYGERGVGTPSRYAYDFSIQVTC